MVLNQFRNVAHVDCCHRLFKEVCRLRVDSNVEFRFFSFNLIIFLIFNVLRRSVKPIYRGIS